MRLKVKDLDISSGGPMVGVISSHDARLMDLHTGDRVKVKKGKKEETILLDLGVGKKSIVPGQLGLFEEVLSSLGAKDRDDITIVPARKPLSLDIIKKKLDGKKISKDEIRQVVWDIVHNKLSQVELSYFVAACYLHELDLRETAWLTEAMATQGSTLRLNRYPILDKHCVGGVAGNRTTMLIVPIIAAAGCTIPKTSSRSITSPAGTADTMEVLADVSLTFDRAKKAIKKTNGCIIWGGAVNLAPADDKIIQVERPLSIDAKSQLLASVIAKKKSVGATHLLVDIPYCRVCKISSREKANELKSDFEKITAHLGIRTKVILTDGSQPIGNGIGPALEARDVLWVLLNDHRGPKDLRDKALMMAGILLEIAGKADKGKGIQLAADILKSGRAYKKMVEIIKAQGQRIILPSKIKLGPVTYHLKASRSGIIREIKNKAISKIARVAGAPEDKGAGIYLSKHVGDSVKKGDIIYTVHTYSQDKLDYVKFAMKELDGVVIK
ncbi:AMP phosphorylase [Candidatus Woesearchaeota archaeon]|nr:AMP phosphorylase [Candidatus Woesearchaeota archaeon]